MRKGILFCFVLFFMIVYYSFVRLSIYLYIFVCLFSTYDLLLITSILKSKRNIERFSHVKIQTPNNLSRMYWNFFTSISFAELVACLRSKGIYNAWLSSPDWYETTIVNRCPINLIHICPSRQILTLKNPGFNLKHVK